MPAVDQQVHAHGERLSHAVAQYLVEFVAAENACRAAADAARAALSNAEALPFWDEWMKARETAGVFAWCLANHMRVECDL